MDDERARWNQRYTTNLSIREPSSLITELASRLPDHGRALDVAGGSGRHALWLAQRGLATTLVDVSDVALKQAQQAAQERGLHLETLQRDLETEGPPPGAFDLIVISDYLHRPLIEMLARQLVPAGMLLMVHPTLHNLERFARPSARYLLGPGELAELIAAMPWLEMVCCDEGFRDDGRHVARALVRKHES